MSSCSDINIDFDNIVALDCEMVQGEGKPVMVARVSIVDWYGNCIYNQYVKPTRRVVNYCTPISGITPRHLANGIGFRRAHREVADIIYGRILVGHSVDKDLKSLGCCHPGYNVRDISQYPDYQRNNPPHCQSLQFLAKYFLGIDIQNGAHDSVVDARASMWLYQKVAKAWEQSLQEEEEEEEELEEEYMSNNNGYYSSSSSDY